MSVRSTAARAECAPTPSSRPPRSLKQQVYVLVPRSPYSSSASEAIGTHNPLTPLRVHNMQSASSLTKRRHPEENPNEMDLRVNPAPETKPKRRKVAAATQQSGTTRATTQTVITSNATPEFPNGFFYCHQCNKKRDSAVGLYCTFNNKPSNVARCRAKYCRPCLRNRYGQDSDEIKGRGINGSSKDTAGHDKSQGYIFKCPRCNGNCNCRGCRKAMGLEPTGNLTLAAKKTGADSVAVMLDGNSKMTGILPGKGRQIPDPPPKPKVPKPPKAPNAAPAPTAMIPKPKRPVNRQPKPLPKVTWTPLPVPPSFTLDRALPRIAIREFVVRFGKLLDMSRAHLEELEEIGGRRPHEVDDADSDSEQDIEVEMGWISETCLRAILLGLLNLLLSDSSGGGKQKAIQGAIEEIKASRANLSRIWGALASLRADIEKADGRLIFPDPLSPPQRTKIHTTRSGALSGAGVNVTTTAQLVPIVLPLIEMVLETQAVHDELEEGVKEAKERIKEERERAKAIREQWDMTKKNGNPGKAARAEHHRSLSALEQALRVTLHTHAPRFTPLGIDHAGRTYIALTPSIAEREAASSLLSGDTSKGGGKARGRAIISSDERSAMRRWGWFIAIWGQKPTDAVLPPSTNDDTDDDEEDDDMDNERWWGLWQSDEIRKLAEWIAIKNELSVPESGDGTMLQPRSGAQSSNKYLTPLSDATATDTEDEDGGRVIPTQNGLKTLVGSLREYAEVMDWRAWRMEEEPGVDDKENGATKRTKAAQVKAVSPANFYGQ